MIKTVSIDEAINYILKNWESTMIKPVFLTGAGLSVSAGIPLWNDVKKDLYKDLFDIDDPDGVEKKFLKNKFGDKKWLKDNVLLEEEKGYSENISKLISKKKFLPPELVLSFYRSKYGLVELQTFLMRHYEKYNESLSYLSLIKLLELDFFRFYVTPNQDGVFEKCLSKYFTSTRFLSLIEEQDFNAVLNQLNDKGKIEFKFLESKRLIIGNLHGVYYKPNTLQINPNLLIQPLPEESPFYKFLKIALDSTDTLLIIGYKGADVDISGALEKILANKKNFKIFWLKKGEDIPELLTSTNLEKVDKWLIIGEADEFLSKLEIEFSKTTNKNVKLSIKDIPYPPFAENSPIEIKCSAPGSLIIAGDYGVYINGKMIQLQIPLRAYAVRLPSNDKKDESFYFDPYLGSWEEDQNGKDYINKARKMIKALREGNWEIFKEKKDKGGNIIFSNFPPSITEMFKECRTYINENFSDSKEEGTIHTYSQFPTGSGCGDTLPYVILAAMLLPQNGEEIKLEEVNKDIKKILVLLSKLWTWCYTYPNASHLRILPTFWNGNKIFILDRSSAQEKAFNKDLNSIPFMQSNLLIDTFSILNNGKGIKFDPSIIDFAVAYYPRRIILTEKEIQAMSGTQVGVFEIKYKRDKLLLEVMAKFTAEVERTSSDSNFSEVAKVNRIGKIISACHFGFVSLGRGSRLVNELVGVLSGIRGIYGAKTSGGGPAGALLIAYNPKEVDFSEMQAIIERYQHKIICYSVLSGKK